MNTVDRPNRDALNSALDIYRDAMRSFIVRCLKKAQGTQVEDVIRDALNDRQAEQFNQNLRQNDNIEAAIDINDFPPLISRNWRDIFWEQFDGDMTVQNRLWLIKDARDKAAHPGQRDMDTEFVRTNLYQIADVLGKINVPTQKQSVEKIRDQLVTPSSQSDPPIAPAQTQSEPTTQPSRSNGNLTPWREVIRPNTDVQQGIFQEAEFAADLQQVYDGRASATNYGNPVSFFNHTYITPGIRTLLVNTLKRLSGNGGDPVIQTKTGFGGGKTHSLIALYHLVNSTDALTNPTGNEQSDQTYDEIRGLMEEAGLDTDSDIQARGAVKGIDARQIRLGVVQPGQGVSVYNEALNRMSGDLYYLYSSDDRYYFHAEENLNKVATDRAGALNNREINEHIVTEIQEAVRRQSEVIICPNNSSAVPESDAVRLVVLPPDKPLPIVL